MPHEKSPKTSERTKRAIDSSYQPSKAELEADVSINASPEVVARALVRTFPTSPRATKAERPMNSPIPFDFPQQDLFIQHDMDGSVVPQRPRDGYINATLLCQRANKMFADYYRLAGTKEFLDVLSADMGIPISALVQVVKGGNDRLSQGTWVHPQVAIHLGQWLSPAFAVKVGKWVFDWMNGNVQSHMPVHVRRYLKNRAKIPVTHFSMLNEIYLHLFAPLEDLGIIPPDKMMPDISTGRMFSDFLRKKGIDPERFPTYEHEFADSSRPNVRPRMYPIEVLLDFRLYFHQEWLPKHAEKYFAKRFPKALPHLPKIRQLTA